jgi:hypothetical protein
LGGIGGVRHGYQLDVGAPENRPSMVLSMATGAEERDAKPV